MALIAGLPPFDIKKGEMVAMDIEMFGQDKNKLHRPHGEFACLSIAARGNVYQAYTLAELKEAMKRVSRGVWVFHNALYDLRQMGRFVPLSEHPVWDTMLVERALYGGFYSDSFSLADLSRRYLEKFLDKELQSSFADTEKLSPAMAKYAGRDAEYTLKIALLQKKQEDIFKVPYWEVDEPTIWGILDMKPIRVDVDRWLKLAKSFERKAEKLEKELGFNVYSQKQVLAALRGVGLNLSQADEPTLKPLEDDYPIVAGILKCRGYRKAKSTYGEAWVEKHVEMIDGVPYVFPDAHVVGAETGRMSYANPNMQNIPVRDIPEYRECFIPSEGNVWGSWDASQQEPRCFCYLSGDTRLLEIFESGEDVYVPIARAIHDNPKLTKKDKKERDLAKTVFLGLQYGLTEYGLSRRTNLTEEEALKMVDKFFRTFAGMKNWIDKQRSNAPLDEYVQTSMGRRIWINRYNKQWPNNAINAPAQGTAAEMTKLAYRYAREEFIAKGLPNMINLIVHDEINADFPKKLEKRYLKIMNDAWMQAAERTIPGIPFAEDSHIGTSWGCKDDD